MAATPTIGEIVQSDIGRHGVSFLFGPLHLENLGLGPPLQRVIEDRQDVHSRPQSTVTGTIGMSGRGPDDWGHLAVKKTLARGQLDYGRVDVGRRRSFGGCSRKALGLLTQVADGTISALRLPSAYRTPSRKRSRSPIFRSSV